MTESLDVFGTLNGIDPTEIVTLSGVQSITGTITFKHLEITEELIVSIHFQLLALINFVINIYDFNRSERMEQSLAGISMNSSRIQHYKKPL